MPVLLIWGDCDPLSPVAVGEALKSHFANAQLRIIPGGEHDVAFKHAHLIALSLKGICLKNRQREQRVTRRFGISCPFTSPDDFDCSHRQLTGWSPLLMA